MLHRIAADCLPRSRARISTTMALLSSDSWRWPEQLVCRLGTVRWMIPLSVQGKHMQSTPKTKTRRQRASYSAIPAGLTPDACVRLPQIIGDARANPPLAGIFPTSKSQFYRLIQQGRFPSPLKPSPGSRASYWRYGDVLAAIKRLEDDQNTVNYMTPLMRKRDAAS